jgi:hypothetical protein
LTSRRHRRGYYLHTTEVPLVLRETFNPVEFHNNLSHPSKVLIRYQKCTDMETASMFYITNSCNIVYVKKLHQIRVITIVNRDLRLNNRDIKISPGFCYLGSVVSKDVGARMVVNVGIQKAWGSFSKLRKVWLFTSIRKDTNIRIFNACMKSVLFYGCETWLVTS